MYGSANHTPSSRRGCTVAPTCTHAAAMMSPPQVSSQVWGRERASQTSRAVARGPTPPRRVTFSPNPSQIPSEIARRTSFRSSVFSSR